MGLRDALDELMRIQDSSAGFAKGAQQLRQQVAAQDLATQAPDLLNQGQAGQGQLASLAASAGDPSVLRDLISNQAKMQSNAKTKPASDNVRELYKNALGVEIPAGISEDELKNFAKIKGDFIKQDANLAAKASAQTAKEAQATKKEANQAAGKITGKVADAEKKYDEKLSRLTSDLSSFQKNPTKQMGGLLKTAIIQGMQEGSRIPQVEFDAQSFKSAFGDKQNAIAYLTGTAPNAFTPEQKAETMRLAQIAIDDVKHNKDTTIKQMFGTMLKGARPLYQGGAVHEGIKDLANERGWDVSVNENGAPVVSSKDATTTLKGAYHDAATTAGKIKDPARKQAALRNIAAASSSGQPLPPAFLQAIAEDAGR